MAEAKIEKVLLTAPAGNIGSRVGIRLAEAGAAISVLALEADVERLPAIVRERAEVHVGTLANRDDVAAAARGADSLLFVPPPVFDAEDPVAAGEAFAANVLAACTANRIERAVLISSQGAGSSAAALIEQLQQFEARMREAVPRVRALRPGPLMENFLNEVEPIAAGALPLLAAPTTPLTLIAAADVGEVAAELLLDPSWSGFEAVPLRGPDVLVPGEIAERLTTMLGREISYVQIGAPELVAEMVKFGIARGSAEAIAAVMEQAAEVTEPEEPGTQVTSTAFAAFVDERLRPAVDAVAADPAR